MNRLPALNSSVAAAQHAMADSPHRVIGRYEIQRSIGAGGMGVLWLARDPMIDRPVAIKLMREGVESSSSRERFLREARSAGRLHHPNIVTIFDVGEHEGQPFIAMQYIEGKTLAEIVQRRAPVSVVRKLQWMEDLCAGLHYAHRAGIVHRDIKPANVMVDRDGSVRILDFGIARLGPAGLTQGVIGTLNYMAPEQLEGRPIDGRADIFALGALFYELLAYELAFPGGIDEGVLAKILYHDPRPIEWTVPDIDTELVEIVGRCLSKKADDRYADCLALAQAVAGVRLRLGQESDDAPKDAAAIEGTTPVRLETETPRRARPPVDLRRTRTVEIDSHLSRARTSMATGAYEDALRECERALVLDPAHGEATQLAGVVRQALERRQIEQWVTEGREELSRGGVTAASLLVERALTVDSASQEAIGLRDAVEAARQGRKFDAVTEAPAATEVYAEPRIDDAVAARPSPRLFRFSVAAVATLAIVAALWLWPRTSPSPLDTPAPATTPEAPAAAAPSPAQTPSPAAAAPPTDARPQAANVDRGSSPAATAPAADNGRGQRGATASPATAPTTAPIAPLPSPAVTTTIPANASAGRGDTVSPNRPAEPPPAAPVAGGLPSASALGRSEAPPSTPSAPTPAAAPAPPPNTATEAERAAAARAADETAVRAVLAEYKSAYERLDAAGVKRVVPSLSAAQERRLADQFRDYKSYSLQLQNVSVSVSGTTATVRGRVARTMVPKAGRSQTVTTDASFELQKEGAGWVITKLSDAASR